MVKSCSAYNCKNRSLKGSDISFHHFPTNMDMKVKWVLAMGREEFCPTKHSVLCSKHFRATDFLRLEPTKILRQDAVPSRFNDKRQFNSSQTQESQFEEEVLDSEETAPSSPHELANDAESEVTHESGIEELSNGDTLDNNQNMEVNEVQLISSYIKETQNEKVEVHHLDLINTLSQLEDYKSGGNQIEIIDCDDVDCDSTSAANLKNENKRKHVYLGDYTEEDFQCPENAKNMWLLAKRKLAEKNNTIKSLRIQNARLKNKLAKLTSLLGN